jgi:hypothetical protein
MRRGFRGRSAFHRRSSAANAALAIETAAWPAHTSLRRFRILECVSHPRATPVRSHHEVRFENRRRNGLNGAILIVISVRTGLEPRDPDVNASAALGERRRLPSRADLDTFLTKRRPEHPLERALRDGEHRRRKLQGHRAHSFDVQPTRSIRRPDVSIGCAKPSSSSNRSELAWRMLAWPRDRGRRFSSRISTARPRRAAQRPASNPTGPPPTIKTRVACSRACSSTVTRRKESGTYHYVSHRLASARSRLVSA